MRLIYTLSIYFYGLGIGVASFFNTKAKLWINGRKSWKVKLTGINPQNKSLIWFHCASLGEFEQGKPVLEQLRKNYPNHFLLLTFFSPSGFIHKKNEPLVDSVIYLPLDTPSNARYFIGTLKPELAVFVKYEFWFNLLYEAQKISCKTILISGIFRANHFFFKPYGKWMLKQVSQFDALCVQNQESYLLLINNGLDIKKIHLTGDTRFDRVNDLKFSAFATSHIEKWKNNKKLLIAGSVWEADADLIYDAWHLIRDSFKIIVVPHELNSRFINKICKRFTADIYKDSGLNTDSDVLVVDRIGILSRIYRTADACYVGGGFNKGIHNTLEPAVYGKAVFFGPVYQKFDEAKGLISEQAALSVKSAEEMSNALVDGEKIMRMGKNAERYIAQNVGATTKSLNVIKPYLAYL